MPASCHAVSPDIPTYYVMQLWHLLLEATTPGSVLPDKAAAIILQMEVMLVKAEPNVICVHLSNFNPLSAVSVYTPRIKLPPCTTGIYIMPL